MSKRTKKRARTGKQAETADPAETTRRWWPFQRKKKPRRTLWESTRETLDSILIALVLASIFRTFIMEAFEIPTGSMAPTLYGRHVGVTCPQCKHFFSVGVDQSTVDQSAEDRRDDLPRPIVCPACGTRLYRPDDPSLYGRDYETLERPLRITGGDRILVDKAAYTLGRPKRWDVGVFVNPHDHSVNYIKRVVGLPGDRLLIQNGDVFIVDSGNQKHIAQKPDGVQAVLWMPVFDSDFPPGGSWKRPWPDDVLLTDLTQHRSDDGRTWIAPWRPTSGVGTWNLSGKALIYSPAPGDSRRSMVTFAWPALDTYGYGQRARRQRRFDAIRQVGDVRVRALVTLGTKGVILATIIEDDHRIDYVLSADKNVPSTVHVRGVDEAGRPGDKRPVPQSVVDAPLLSDGQPTRIAFVNVDDRAWIEVDGRRHLGMVDYTGWFSVPRDDADTTGEKSILLGAAGAGVRLTRVRIDRDIYYTATMGSEDPRVPADAYGVAGSDHAPYALGDDEYFVLGDHSPSSSDSRRWARFGGERPAVVPRNHFIGKALVLYWPRLERVKFIR